MNRDRDLDPQGSAREIADGQFVHGLLEFLHRDDEHVQAGRIDRLMSAIDGDAAITSTTTTRRVPWPALLTAAALLVVLAVFGLSEQPNGRAVVNAAVEAAREAPQRRYSVKAYIGADNPPAMVAQLDIRDRHHMLLRAHAHGVPMTFGRHPDGSWLIDADGNVHRLHAEEHWPRWIDVGGHAVMLDSVDDLLLHLDPSYDLRLTGDAELRAFPGVVLEHVVATPRAAGGPHPDGIEVWVDRGAHLVHRMELRWAHAHGAGHDSLHPHPPHGQHAPTIVHGPPSQGASHAARPHRLVFELVPAPPFAPDWFTPEAHAK